MRFKLGDMVVVNRVQLEAAQRRAKRGKAARPPKIHRFDPHAMERYGMKHGEAYEVIGIHDSTVGGHCIDIRVGDREIGPLSASRFHLEGSIGG
jgi:hypothetical protein